MGTDRHEFGIPRLLRSLCRRCTTLCTAQPSRRCLAPVAKPRALPSHLTYGKGICVKSPITAYTKLSGSRSSSFRRIRNAERRNQPSPLSQNLASQNPSRIFVTFSTCVSSHTWISYHGKGQTMLLSLCEQSEEEGWLSPSLLPSSDKLKGRQQARMTPKTQVGLRLFSL